jgi:hypothetical protein
MKGKEKMQEEEDEEDERPKKRAKGKEKVKGAGVKSVKGELDDDDDAYWQNSEFRYRMFGLY